MLKNWSNLIFGMECLGCGSESSVLDPWLCPGCLDKLKKLSNGERYPAEGVVCLFPMEELTRKLIHLLKYKSLPGMASYLVKQSSLIKKEKSEILEEFVRPLYFTPVPLHRARYRERGYNQAECIAIALANVTGGSLCRFLRRKTFRVSQTKLSQKERELNVANAFVARFPKEIPKKGTLVIVDDVYTTGATTGACIDALGKDFPLDVKVCTLLYDSPISAKMDYVADKKLYWDGKIIE